MKKYSKILIGIVVLLVLVYGIKLGIKFISNLYFNSIYSLKEVRYKYENDSIKFIGKTEMGIGRLIYLNTNNMEIIAIKWNSNYYKEYLNPNIANYKVLQDIKYITKPAKEQNINNILSCIYARIFSFGYQNKNEIVLGNEYLLLSEKTLGNKKVFKGKIKDLGISLYNSKGYIFKFNTKQKGKVVFYEDGEQLYTFISYGNKYYDIEDEQIIDFISLLNKDENIIKGKAL
ncbi:hypothetical protein [Orenia marismortui]|uniref:Uncharacterized protein n=1 Tax=Orenia marismortui TaxID=46469 RepID=A0A4R8H1E9_9FIRM|nr:hypothetical protein [Orenia marismortui]TDX53264.1 hypothetical protein C7959_103116 [Orenia marismortui]